MGCFRKRVNPFFTSVRYKMGAGSGPCRGAEVAVVRTGRSRVERQNVAFRVLIEQPVS